MNRPNVTAPEEIWEHLVDGQEALDHARRQFFAEGVDRVALVRNALSHPRGEHRAMALNMLQHMKPAEQMQLFKELVSLARAAHGPFFAAWKIILSLPREWALAHIEPE